MIILLKCTFILNFIEWIHFYKEFDIFINKKNIKEKKREERERGALSLSSLSLSLYPSLPLSLSLSLSNNRKNFHRKRCTSSSSPSACMRKGEGEILIGLEEWNKLTRSSRDCLQETQDHTDIAWIIIKREKKKKGRLSLKIKKIDFYIYPLYFFFLLQDHNLYAYWWNNFVRSLNTHNLMSKQVPNSPT